MFYNIKFYVNPDLRFNTLSGIFAKISYFLKLITIYKYKS